MTNVNFDLVADALNSAAGTNYDASFLTELGRETLEAEWEFNRQAGFTDEDDELPDFFYDEALEPSGNTQRHRAAEVNKHMRELLAGK